ncbi:YhcN/YlaJ family sporulation lipoprotein [Gracilibacillus massiliensis]|uniref:YhcN/YlaJ family sporulation lipoprotein n=1 Tax=Gracilibacillus massiliensis TaxID=1564956 RepID=UPI00071E47D4|nr:YhcN/YlaJ family sporulation lipoprotein [Gracilibacillus massiliensis]
MKQLHIVLFFILMSLAACNNPEQTTQNNSSDIVMLNSDTPATFEQNSIPRIAQSYLDDQSNGISTYRAIHVNDQLFVAFNATPLKQATEQKVEKKVKNDLKTLTKINHIHVTSDQKFFMELTKLENEKLTKDETIKRLKKLEKLSKEQT